MRALCRGTKASKYGVRSPTSRVVTMTAGIGNMVEMAISAVCHHEAISAVVVTPGAGDLRQLGLLPGATPALSECSEPLGVT